jgi:GT2 family glycosyltransferase
VKKIAIVVLNWNGATLLERFLPSVIENSTSDCQVYVADNGSTDSSITFLKNTFPEVIIISLQENYGFAGGYNKAIKQVHEPLLCLLNSDVAPAKYWLTPIFQAFELDKSLAIAQPKILDELNKASFEYAGAAGGYLDAFGYPFCRGRIFQSIELDQGQFNDIEEIFWATGACMFIRNEIFQSLEGFDEDYFAHQEEVDLCWRAKNKGHKISYIGNSEVYHLGGSTLSNMNPKKTFLNFRNSLFSLLKNLPLKRSIPLIIGRLVLDAVAGLRFILQGKPMHCLAIIHAHFSFYKLAKKIYKKNNISPKPIKYYHTTSIVWSHYMRGIKYFSQLVKN